MSYRILVILSMAAVLVWSLSFLLHRCDKAVVCMASDLLSLIVGTVSTIIAVFALVANIILLHIFRKCPDIRRNVNKFQLVIIFAEIIYGIGSIIQYIDLMRINYYYNWYTAYYCAFINSTMLFGGVLLVSVTLCLSLERLLSLSWPLYFRNIIQKNPRWFWSSMVVLLIFSVIFVIMSFYGINNHVKPYSCIPNAIRIPLLKPMLSYFYCITGAAIIIIYGGVLGLIKYRSHLLLGLALDMKQNQAFADEIKACRVISVIVVSSACFYVIPNIILAILSIRGVTSTSEIGIFVNFFGCCNSLVGLPLYLWRDKSVRIGFMDVMSLKHGPVSVSNVD